MVRCGKANADWPALVQTRRCVNTSSMEVLIEQGGDRVWMGPGFPS
jgi:hypothetical protein